jgi:hypothetical protein
MPKTPENDIVLRPFEKRRIALALVQAALIDEADGNTRWGLSRQGVYLRRQFELKNHAGATVEAVENNENDEI